MQPPTPPKITGVEVETARPTEAESAAIARLSAETDRALPQMAQVVKVRFSSKPPITSMAWGLYVDDVLIPKYWEYEDGIYFTVIDPKFFTDHQGEPLRFSQNGVDFFDTGMRLPGPTESSAAATPRRAAARASKKRAAKSSKKRASKKRASKKRAAKSASKKR